MIMMLMVVLGSRAHHQALVLITTAPPEDAKRLKTTDYAEKPGRQTHRSTAADDRRRQNRERERTEGKEWQRERELQLHDVAAMQTTAA